MADDLLQRVEAFIREWEHTHYPGEEDVFVENAPIFQAVADFARAENARLTERLAEAEKANNELVDDDGTKSTLEIFSAALREATIYRTRYPKQEATK